LWALIASGAAALVTVAIRLIERTPVSQALGGIIGIGIGVFWAWRTGDATDFFAFGLWQNGMYLAIVLLLQIIRWPAVGIVIELLRTGFNANQVRELPKEPLEPGVRGVDEGTRIAHEAEQLVAGQDDLTLEETRTDESLFKGFSQWRNDPDLLKRYLVASWFWVALFAIRLAIQLPLYFYGAVGWLGTARLLMGVPLWALVLYGTWIVTRRAHHPRIA
jgi:hypothetical protein